MPTTTDRTDPERRAWETQGRFLNPGTVYTGDLTTRVIYRRLSRHLYSSALTRPSWHWSFVIADELAERDMNPTVWLPSLAAWLDRSAVEVSATYTRHADDVRHAVEVEQV